MIKPFTAEFVCWKTIGNKVGKSDFKRVVKKEIICFSKWSLEMNDHRLLINRKPLWDLAVIEFCRRPEKNYNIGVLSFYITERHIVNCLSLSLYTILIIIYFPYPVLRNANWIIFLGEIAALLSDVPQVEKMLTWFIINLPLRGSSGFLRGPRGLNQCYSYKIEISLYINIDYSCKPSYTIVIFHRVTTVSGKSDAIVNLSPFPISFCDLSG